MADSQTGRDSASDYPLSHFQMLHDELQALHAVVLIYVEAIRQAYALAGGAIGPVAGGPLATSRGAAPHVDQFCGILAMAT